MDDKVPLACWPISRMIGSELRTKIKFFYVFSEGKSAILTTVDNDVFAVGLNPYGVLGTGKHEACTKPTKIQGITAGWCNSYKAVMGWEAEKIILSSRRFVYAKALLWLYCFNYLGIV